MFILPCQIMVVLKVFSERVLEWAKVLVVGAILSPQKRTVSAVLRVMGLSDEAQLLNRPTTLWETHEVAASGVYRTINPGD
jgi:hypothetical protein